jgi:uncharacterized protein (TIGR02271 family)
MNRATKVKVSETTTTGTAADAVAVGAAGGPRITLRTEDGQEVIASPQSLQRLPDGTYRLSLGETELTELNDALRRSGGASAVIPVVAEELHVGRQAVETGRVRVTKVVHEDQETVDQPVTAEEVVVERVPVNQYVEVAPAARQDGDTLVLPVLEEVLVVERKLLLKEEVRITTRRTESRQPQTVTLRREEVKIERIPGESGGAGT